MKVKRFKTETYDYQIRNPKIIYEPNRVIDVSGTVINKDFPDLTNLEFRYGVFTFLYWRPLTGPDHELEHRLYFARYYSQELAFRYLFVCRRNDPIFKVDRIDVRIETDSKHKRSIKIMGVYVSIDTCDEDIIRNKMF